MDFFPDPLCSLSGFFVFSRGKFFGKRRLFSFFPFSDNNPCPFLRIEILLVRGSVAVSGPSPAFFSFFIRKNSCGIETVPFSFRLKPPVFFFFFPLEKILFSSECVVTFLLLPLPLFE